MITKNHVFVNPQEVFKIWWLRRDLNSTPKPLYEGGGCIPHSQPKFILVFGGSDSCSQDEAYACPHLILTYTPNWPQIFDIWPLDFAAQRRIIAAIVTLHQKMVQGGRFELRYSYEFMRL